MAQALYPWLPARWLVRTRFDNLAKIGRSSAPVFIAHGQCDTVVPFRQARSLFAAAKQPKVFFPIAGGDHNDPQPPEFYDALRRFLAKTRPPVICPPFTNQ
jgi:fermentation-respiration switch protein FrsA (DUF1100 family)